MRASLKPQVNGGQQACGRADEEKAPDTRLHFRRFAWPSFSLPRPLPAGGPPRNPFLSVEPSKPEIENALVKMGRAENQAREIVWASTSGPRERKGLDRGLGVAVEPARSGLEAMSAAGSAIQFATKKPASPEATHHAAAFLARAQSATDRAAAETLTISQRLDSASEALTAMQNLPVDPDVLAELRYKFRDEPPVPRNRPTAALVRDLDGLRRKVNDLQTKVEVATAAAGVVVNAATRASPGDVFDV